MERFPTQPEATNHGMLQRPLPHELEQYADVLKGIYTDEYPEKSAHMRQIIVNTESIPKTVKDVATFFFEVSCRTTLYRRHIY
jgi:hypothetical protein